MSESRTVRTLLETALPPSMALKLVAALAPIALVPPWFGKAWAETELGKGTVFHFTLQVAVEPRTS